MQAHQLPTQRGWQWLFEGFQLWRRSPALLSFVAFGYLLVLLVINIFPVIGQPIASLLMPVLSLGVLNACRAVDERRRVGPEVLFSGFRSNVQSLIAIGGLHFAATLIILGLTALADGGTLLKVMTGGAVEREAAEAPAFLFALLIALALSTPVMMAYWFAPLLVGWWKLDTPKSLFFSFYACLRNWRPFLAYSIGLALFAALLPGLLLGIIGMVSPTLATLLSVPLPLLLIPMIFASFYANARDIFGVPGDEPAQP